MTGERVLLSASAPMPSLALCYYAPFMGEHLQFEKFVKAAIYFAENSMT